MAVENLGPEILAAQARLEEKRRSSKVVELRRSMEVREILPEISRTTQTSGEFCRLHHVEMVDGSCPVCLEQEAKEVRRRAERAAHEIATRIGNIRLGKRYAGVTFDDFGPPCDDAAKVKAWCQRYAATFKDRLAGCDNLLLLGNPGTGKNMLAAAICNQLAVDGYQAYHTTAMRVVRRITETWHPGSSLSEQQVIDSFTLPDLLVVDEVGVQFGSRKEEILLFEVLNGRYEEKRPTVLISNLDLSGIEAFLGPRVLDRFYEGKSAVLEFTWDSYRRKQR